MLRNIFAAIIAALTLSATSARAETQGLVTDISSHQIAISSNFRGTSLLLFGAIDWSRVPIPATEKKRGVASWRDRPFDVIMVVTGPKQTYRIRKKSEVGGIWLNTGSAEIRDLPSFYALAATRDPQDILLPEVLEKTPLGLDSMVFDWSEQPPADEAADYRQAIFRDRILSGVYSERPTSLQVLDDTLFRAEIYFPANVPVGRYRAEIYLVRNGTIISQQSAPLSVDKIGLERAIHVFANTRPATYGVLCVILAVSAGLIAGALSRRFSS